MEDLLPHLWVSPNPAHALNVTYKAGVATCHPAEVGERIGYLMHCTCKRKTRVAVVMMTTTMVMMVSVSAHAV